MKRELAVIFLLLALAAFAGEDIGKYDPNLAESTAVVTNGMVRQVKRDSNLRNERSSHWQEIDSQLGRQAA